MGLLKQQLVGSMPGFYWAISTSLRPVDISKSGITFINNAVAWLKKKLGACVLNSLLFSDLYSFKSIGQQKDTD